MNKTRLLIWTFSELLPVFLLDNFHYLYGINILAFVLTMVKAMKDRFTLTSLKVLCYLEWRL